MLKTITAVRRAAGRFVRRRVGWQEHGRVAYSQEGEDLLIYKLLRLEEQRQHDGYYVDVGAHDPFRYSNTAIFYRLGWTGINVDPRPGMATIFGKARPRDTNLEIAVSSMTGNLDFV